MPKKHLTDAAVERYARPAQGRTEISDSDAGLFLWVTAGGVKSWAVIYRLPDMDGKRTARRKTVIGRHPAMRVAMAREKSREMMELAAAGIDPEIKAAEEREAMQAAKVDRETGSFGAVAEDYIAAMHAGKLVGGRKRPVASTTAKGRQSLLNRLVIPVFGSKAIAEVTQKDVATTLARIEATGGPVDETLKVIRGVFKFGMSRGFFHGSLPTSGMTNRQAAKKETRALTDIELRDIWLAAGEQGWPFGSVIRMLMLTGQRKQEIAALRWQEVDWERKLLVIPAERVKNRAGAHEVPLSDVALQILQEARSASEASANSGLPMSDLVFPSDTGQTPISGWSKLKAKLDTTVRGNIAGVTSTERRAIRAAGALRMDTRTLKADALAKINATEIAHWRIHDLCHTFITRCRDGEENAEGEIVWSAPLDVLQATVNHEITAGVTKVYDHGDIQRRYRLRKRELMDWWSRKLLTIVEAEA